MPGTGMSLLEMLRRIPDRRDNRGKRHEQWVMLLIVVVSYMCGIRSISRMALIAREWKEWYRRQFGIEAIPSRDTIRRNISLLDTDELLEAVRCWKESFFTGHLGHHVAADGKAVKAAAMKVRDGRAPFLLNLYDVDEHTTIDQMLIPDKNNEMTCLPRLLDRNPLQGCLVSTDAIGLSRRTSSPSSQQRAVTS